MATSKTISDVMLKQSVRDIMQTIADNIYEFSSYTDEELADVFDLSDTEAMELQKTINDTIIAKNKVYSNEHTNELLNELEARCNQFTTEQIGKSNKLEKAVITDISKVTDENKLYLLLTDATTNTYMQYMLINGIVTSLGSTQVDMSGYVKEDDLTTKLADYAKNNEVLKANSVINDLTIVNNDTVLSSQGTSDELNKKVDKTSMVTSIDITSTDDTIPSTKAVYDYITDNLNGEVINRGDLFEWAKNQTTNASCFCEESVANLPINGAGSVILTYHGGGIKSMIYINHLYVYKNFFNSVSWSGWQKIGGKGWNVIDIALESNLTEWGINQIIVPNIIDCEKIRLFDETNSVWTPVIDNILSSSSENDSIVYTNGLGITDGYEFSQRIDVNFKGGAIVNVTMRVLNANCNPPKFTKVAYFA